MAAQTSANPSGWSRRSAASCSDRAADPSTRVQLTEAGIDRAHRRSYTRAVVWRKCGVAATAALLSLLSFGGAAHAASQLTWTGAGDHVHWSDPANWSTNTPPIDGDSVAIANASTNNDLPPGLHLASLSYLGGQLTGNALTIDDVADVWDTYVHIKVGIDHDTTWHLGVYESFLAIDLNGHHLAVAPGPNNHGVPVRYEGFLTLGSIIDTVGGSSVSVDPTVQLDLVGPSSWTGIVSGGRVNMWGAWPNLSYNGATLSLGAGATMARATVSENLSVFPRYFQKPSDPHSTVRSSISLAPGATFTIDADALPLQVLGVAHIDGAQLALAQTPGSGCPFTQSVMQSGVSGSIVGRFGRIYGVDGTPDNPYVHDTLTPHYAGNDVIINEVSVTCALAVPPTTPTAPRTTIVAAGSTTSSGGIAAQELPRTGTTSAPAGALGGIFFALGCCAVYLGRRRIARPSTSEL